MFSTVSKYFDVVTDLMVVYFIEHDVRYYKWKVLLTIYRHCQLNIQKTFAKEAILTFQSISKKTCQPSCGYIRYAKVTSWNEVKQYNKANFDAFLPLRLTMHTIERENISFSTFHTLTQS